MTPSSSIVDALDNIKGLHPGIETPTPQRLDAIRALVTPLLAPVRPLPSNSTLTLLVIAGFVAFSTLVTFPLGFAGFLHLSPNQRLLYYSVVLLSAVWLSTSLVKEIIPGSKRLVRPWFTFILPVVLLALMVLALFPDHNLSRFVVLGLPCLRLGIICAAVSGLLAYPLLRKGYSSSPLRTGITAGVWAGLTGIAVLALHCRLQNSAHILVWHLAPMLIAAAAGALIGRLVERYSSASTPPALIRVAGV